MAQTRAPSFWWRRRRPPHKAGECFFHDPCRDLDAALPKLRADVPFPRDVICAALGFGCPMVFAVFARVPQRYATSLSIHSRRLSLCECGQDDM